jgi:hypothetical protein
VGGPVPGDLRHVHTAGGTGKLPTSPDVKYNGCSSGTTRQATTTRGFGNRTGQLGNVSVESAARRLGRTGRGGGSLLAQWLGCGGSRRPRGVLQLRGRPPNWVISREHRSSDLGEPARRDHRRSADANGRLFAVDGIDVLRVATSFCFLDRPAALPRPPRTSTEMDKSRNGDDLCRGSRQFRGSAATSPRRTPQEA